MNPRNFARLFEHNPYNDYGCPLCEEHANGSCRCRGPHSMEELQKGHGLHCANGHRWSGNLVFDANESKGKDKIPLTPKERDEVTDRFGPGPHECSFARDEDGYYCYTHRARSKSYPSISKIPKDKYEFIGSTG